MQQAHRVLIVDDDEANLFTLEALLEDADFSVEPFSSYAAAEARIHEGSPVDLVILDRGLGLNDGAELAPLCVQRWPEVRVAVLSGREQEGETLTGVHSQHTKGGDVDVFIESLRRLVSERQ